MNRQSRTERPFAVLGHQTDGNETRPALVKASELGIDKQQQRYIFHKTKSSHLSEILTPNSVFMDSKASALPIASSTGLCVCGVLTRCLKLANMSLATPL